MAFSIPLPDEADGPIRRFASSLAAVGLVSGCYSLLPIAGSRDGEADEMLGGQRGLAKNSGVSGTEGSVIPSGI